MGLFDIFKNKKPREEAAMEELIRRTFPGGGPEMDFKSTALVNLSNGKLGPNHALGIYAMTKLKLRLSFEEFDGEKHLGPDIHEWIENIRSHSRDVLTLTEASRVLAYIILDKIPATDKDVEELFQWRKGIFGQDGVGSDSDVIELGIGDFGHEITNPIPVRGVAANTIYLNRLRTLDSREIQYKRRQSCEVSTFIGRVDEYEIYQDDKRIARLYIHPYNQKVSRRAPRGFMLVT